MSAATLAAGGVFASTTNTDERLILLDWKERKKRERKKECLLIYLFSLSRMFLTDPSRGKMDVMYPNMKSKVASNCWNVLVLG